LAHTNRTTDASMQSGISLRIVLRVITIGATMLCGSMANPMALTYLSDIMPGERASVSYATVYPISMFVRVIIVQVIVMFFV
jgi:Predicted permease